MIFLREGKLGHFHKLVKMVSAHTLVKMVTVLRMKRDQRLTMLYSENKPILPSWLNCMIFVLSIFKANLQCSKVYGIDLKQKSNNSETSILGSVGANTLPVFVDWFIILVSMWTLSPHTHTVTHTHGNWQLELKQHLKIQ